MEIKEMAMSDIETRSLEIEQEMTSEEADIEALRAEVEKLEARKVEIETEAETRKNEINEIEKEVEVVEEIEKEEVRKIMELKELRNTKEYIDAYATWVKTDDDKELRKVLTSNGTAGDNDTNYPVPEFVVNKINTAWENDEIMSRVTKTFLKGNIKVGFEISGSDAVVHAEGTDAPDEEVLKLGIVSLVPQSIKKWIHISDELYDMGGQEFLDYIYDEISYRIVKKAAAIAIAAILAAPVTSSATAPAVASITQALGAGTIVSAEALLSDEATDVVAIMNRGTWGALKSLQATSGNNVGDVFDGRDVLFTSGLPSYADASANSAYLIVGDLKAIQANFPNGDEIKFKFDDLSEAEADLIKVVGRMYAGIGVVAPNRFVKVLKASS